MISLNWNSLDLNSLYYSRTNGNWDCGLAGWAVFTDRLTGPVGFVHGSLHRGELTEVVVLWWPAQIGDQSRYSYS